MKGLAAWYRRPISVLAFFIVIIILSLFSLGELVLGPKGETLHPVFSVIIQHFGVDSETMEQTITIPLEDAISTIRGIKSLSSTSEFGKSRVNAELGRSADRNQVYLALRDAVDRVYNCLPSSVQKPRILSGALNQRPVFIVSFRSSTLNNNELRYFVEKNIKPAYEKIQGSGEIEVGGGELREIHIMVDVEKAATCGLTIQSIASYLQQQNLLAPLGDLTTKQKKTGLTLFGKMETLQELREIPLPVGKNETRLLGDLAEVRYDSREQDTISRVDGEKRVVLYIRSSGSANLVSLSRQLRKETAAWSAKGFELDIILDSGEKIEKSVFNVLKALLTGMGIVILFLSLFLRRPRIILLLSLSLPVTGLVTTALLAFTNINLDHFVLAGLAVGIGMIIDAGIVITEQIHARDDFTVVFPVIPPLISSNLTTIIVLIPLYFMEEAVEGIRQVTIAIGLLLCVSLVLNILFLPAFTVGKSPRKKKIKKKSARFFYRLCYRLIGMVLRFRIPVIITALVLCLGLIPSFLLPAKDLSGTLEEDTIFAHVEFPGGTALSFTDEITNGLCAQIRRIPGVRRVQAAAKKENAELTIEFDSTRIPEATLTSLLESSGRSLPGKGFLYIPAKAAGTDRKLELAIKGTENAILRELAHSTASALNNRPWVSQTVLHFKEPPPAWSFKVDHDKAGQQGFTVSTLANYLRWYLYGPVALKWQETGNEIDLRIMGTKDRALSIRQLENLVIPGAGGEKTVLNQLGDFVTVTGAARIYRQDRQRAVSFSVHTRGLSLEESASQIGTLLDKVPLPAGYSFVMDRSALEMEKHFRFLWAVLGLSLLLIFMVLASQTESLASPLLILILIPLSLVFPMAALLLKGSVITLPVIVGLVIISGIIVNNGILIVDYIQERLDGLPRTAANLRMSIFYAIRKRIRPLLLTSGTTILGTCPLIFFPSGEAPFMVTLAFIVFWGILGSIFSSLLILPGILATFPRAFQARKSST